MKAELLSKTAFADTKPHYNLLDGLRGVAALLVVWYHVHEGFAFAGGGMITGINHGYLAVDFFFMLSGFVISYAYDDRWAKGFSLKDFFKRRIIRLHPMVVIGAIIGAVTFILQGSVQWDGTHIATSAVMIALLCAMFMIPATPGCRYEVRGNGEMFPLNGPSWSLFFEYLGNVLYALIIRRIPKMALTWLVVVLGMLHVGFAVLNISGYGSIGVGWTIDKVNFMGGMLRMLFPFTAGMLVARNFRAINIRGAFWICSAILLALFCVPYLPQTLKVNDNLSLTFNGAFESFCIVIVFPLLCLAWCIGKHLSYSFGQDLQFPRRYLISALHYPLSVHVSFLCMADRYGEIYFGRDLACGSCSLCRLHLSGLSVPQVV